MTTDLEPYTLERRDHGLSLGLARFLCCKSLARGQILETGEVFRGRFPLSVGGDAVVQHVKASIGAGGTLPLASPQDLSQGFLRSVEPLTALGRLPAPRRVPSLLDLSIATTPAGFEWAAAAMPFKATRLTFAHGDPLQPLKAGAILALTREAVELAARGAEQFVLDELRKSYIAWLDSALLDPTFTAIADVRPASITSGATPISSTGSSVANMIEDARRLVASYSGQGGHMQTAVVILAPDTAVALRVSGHPGFAGLTISGGDYAGIPAVTSEAAGAQIVLLDQSAFYLADANEIDFDVSDQASIEMSDAPTQDGSTGTGASLVNMWQANMRGLKVWRTINWRAAGAVAVIDGVSYSASGSPA